MSMIYSQSCEHAVRALTYLTLLRGTRKATAKEISAAEGLPPQFLSKLLQQMARAGIVTSTKGPGGGFALAVHPRHITLLDVVTCIDGTVNFDRCAVGLADCTDEEPCPLHDGWKLLREAIRQYLTRTTLLDMGNAMERKREALAAKGDTADTVAFPAGATPPQA